MILPVGSSFTINSHLNTQSQYFFRSIYMRLVVDEVSHLFLRSIKNILRVYLIVSHIRCDRKKSVQFMFLIKTNSVFFFFFRSESIASNDSYVQMLEKFIEKNKPSLGCLMQSKSMVGLSVSKFAWISFIARSRMFVELGQSNVSFNALLFTIFPLIPKPLAYLYRRRVI